MSPIIRPTQLDHFVTTKGDDNDVVEPTPCRRQLAPKHAPRALRPIALDPGLKRQKSETHAGATENQDIV
jgi:hypothetical protein